MQFLEVNVQNNTAGAGDTMDEGNLGFSYPNVFAVFWNAYFLLIRLGKPIREAPPRT